MAMSYAAVSDLVSRYGAGELVQRTDRRIPRVVTAAMLETAAADGDLSGLDNGQQAALDAVLVVLEQALTDATETVNGYVASRYPLPLTATPPVLVRMTCELARFNLYEDVCPDHIKTRSDAALKSLRDIADGRLSLGLAQAEANVASGGGVEFSPGSRLMDRNKSKGFI